MPDTARAPVLLWGGPGSGKSGLIGALYDVGCHSDSGDGWSISPGDVPPAATEYLMAMREGLLKRNLQPTQPRLDYLPLDITIRKRQAGRMTGLLSVAFVDPAGELAERADRLHAYGMPLVQAMLRASGVLWLFDSTRAGADHADVIEQLAAYLDANGAVQLTTPLALCLTKIDLLPPERRNRARQDPAAALREHIGAEVFHSFRKAFTTIECFAMSSAGVRDDRIEPVGLSEVFDWIHKIKRARERRAHRGRDLKRLAMAALFVIGVIGVVRLGNLLVIGAAKAREQMRVARLAQAASLHREGRPDSVLALLRDGKAPADPGAVTTWDTLVAFAARDVGLERQLSGDSAAADSLLRLCKEHSDRALPAIQDTFAMVKLRFARAQACMVIGCPRKGIERDLSFVQRNAKDAALRSEARRQIRALRK